MSENNKVGLDELLENWDDVLGVNFTYEFYDEDTEKGKVPRNPISFGINAYSLLHESEMDIVLSWTPDELCELVESFLNQYHELYLNYIINKMKGQMYEEE